MGPGRVAMTTAPSDVAGSVDVELRATGLPDGTRWLGALSASNETGEDSREFRRVAAEGGWTVRATLDEPAPGPQTGFYGIAFSRRLSTCVVALYPRPTVALSFCAANVIAIMQARYRADDSLVVRFSGYARPESRWNIELRANTTDSAQAVAVGVVEARRGLLRVRTTLRGFDDPRLSVVATRASGGTCALHLDPADVTTAPMPSSGALLDRARELGRATGSAR